MAVKSSGPLSITTDIVGEFGGVAPHSISEFYDGAGLVPTGANPNVPSSGAVSFSNFYGAVNVVTISIINNQYDSNGTLVTLDKASTLNLFEIANKTIGSNAGNNVVVPLVFRLDSDTVFNNSIIFGGSFTDITIQNNGIIAGRGGHGANGSQYSPSKDNTLGNSLNGFKGNAAIFVDSDQTKVTITNLEKGFIAGGGDGGNFNTVSDNSSPQPKLFNGEPIDDADATASAQNGGGGGWNGGVGGRGFASVSAFAFKGIPGQTNSFNTGTLTDTERSDPSVANYVVDRTTNITGHTGIVTAIADVYAKNSSSSDLSSLTISGNTSGTGGGSGLNGGSSRSGSNGAKVAVETRALDGQPMGNNSPQGRALAIGVSGSGGGSGIGSSSTPNYVTSSGRNQSAGAGHSIQIKTGSTVSTKSTINNGRIYGDTDIAIS